MHALLVDRADCSSFSMLQCVHVGHGITQGKACLLNPICWLLTGPECSSLIWKILGLLDLLSTEGIFLPFFFIVGIRLNHKEIAMKTVPASKSAYVLNMQSNVYRDQNYYTKYIQKISTFIHKISRVYSFFNHLNEFEKYHPCSLRVFLKWVTKSFFKRQTWIFPLIHNYTDDIFKTCPVLHFIKTIWIMMSFIVPFC